MGFGELIISETRKLRTSKAYLQYTCSAARQYVLWAPMWPYVLWDPMWFICTLGPNVGHMYFGPRCESHIRSAPMWATCALDPDVGHMYSGPRCGPYVLRTLMYC